MLLKNNAPRLIVINGPQSIKKDANGKPMNHLMAGPSWKLLPAGPAVDVDDAVVKGDYVQSLIKAGDVSIAGEVIDSTAEEVDPELEELREECDLREIKYRSNTTKDTLRKKIEEFDAAEEAAL